MSLTVPNYQTTNELGVCPVCNGSEFIEINSRHNGLCVKCGSYERTRLMKMHIDRLYGESLSDIRVLHIAPEYGLSAWLSKSAKLYQAVDIDLRRYAHIQNVVQVDLCDPKFASILDSFDLILHSHVIEHLPCNYTTALLRLHSLLKPGGYHLFSVPIYGNYFDESFEKLDPEAAEKRFGQFDHCRRFSPIDIKDTIGSIFSIPKNPSLLDFFTEQDLIAANIPKENWKSWSGDYVFCVRSDQSLV